VFRVFLVKQHAVFKRKDAISGFPVSPGSAEALVRSGEKTKRILLLTFSVTFLLKIIKIDSCTSKLLQDKVVTF